MTDYSDLAVPDAVVNAALAHTNVQLDAANAGYQLARNRTFGSPWQALDNLYKTHEMNMLRARRAIPAAVGGPEDLRAAQAGYIRAAQQCFDELGVLLTMPKEDLANALAKIAGRALPHQPTTEEQNAEAAQKTFDAAAATAAHAAREGAFSMLHHLNLRSISVTLAADGNLHVTGRANEHDLAQLRGSKAAIVAALSDVTVI